MNPKNKDYGSSLKRIQHAFFMEILLSLCIAATVVLVGMNTLSKQTTQYASNINADYSASVDSYVHEFRFMTNEIKAKLKENPSVDEMTAWLRSQHEIYAEEIGADIFRGIGCTYQGTFIYSFDDGN